MLFLGNLDQIRLLWRYLPEITNPDNHASLSGLAQLGAVISAGIQVILGQAQLPGGASRWFFDASRPILSSGPSTPIVEFPYFTYLYGDMHPHMLSTPILFLALAWIVALFLGTGEKKSWIEKILIWISGGLVFGVFRAVHTWDYPTLFSLALAAFAWIAWRKYRRISAQAVGEIILQSVLLVALSALAYMPFTQWFATGYSTVELWTEARTPLIDYFTVNGLFLFILISFLIYESAGRIKRGFLAWREAPLAWLANNRRLYIGLGIAIVVVCGINLLWFFDLQVFVFVLPLLLWIGLIFLKKGQPFLKKIVLALFAIGLCLSLLVEVVVLKGDDHRSNTVFYFYYQIWSMFSLAAGILIVILIREWRSWISGFRWVWSGALGVLLILALLFPLTGTAAKINTRWPDIPNPPHSLDGMDYMLGESQAAASISSQNPGAIYHDDDKTIDLKVDYQGIHFFQEHVSGTPVIVEAQTPEYRWGSRYSIYTGLPAVAGWSWHVRQHLDLMDGAIVEKRIDEVTQFYNTSDTAEAKHFLTKYHVNYVIIGPLEKAYYDPAGIDKFASLEKDGTLAVAYHTTDATSSLTIYSVKP